MAHFAEIDDNGIVLRVVVIGNAEIIGPDGAESEVEGVSLCQILFGGRWVQTSYSGAIRKHFAGAGFKYDAENDVFITPQPYPSWVLNTSTQDWEPPKPKPIDGRRYIWDEDLVEWRDITDKLGPL